jgi:pyruvate formate lyase activating enzyme
MIKISKKLPGVVKKYLREWVVLCLVLFLMAIYLFPSRRACKFGEEFLNKNASLKEAMFYEKLGDYKVRCTLCPWRCELKDRQKGFCRARINIKGKLYSEVYGKTFFGTLNYGTWGLIYSAMKSNILTIGSPGCNMRCNFCLSWTISTADPEEVESLDFKKASESTSLPEMKFGLNFKLSPQDIITTANKFNYKIISFSLTESTINYEYVLDVSKLARKNGLVTVLCTNGYINEAPLKELLKYVDGVSLGLKGFNNNVYHKYTQADLEPVLKSLLVLKNEDVPFEISYPLIPGVNDDAVQITDMCLWIKNNLGKETMLNFYRYIPSYRLIGLPPTPVETMENAKKIANNIGLKHVYVSYLSNKIDPNFEQEIFCPNCNNLVLSRKGAYKILVNNIIKGKCRFCGEKISFIIVN